MFGNRKDSGFKFETGDSVKDSITGFYGLIIGRTQWLHNCNTYCVKSRELKDGKPMDAQWFDEPQLELIEEKVMEEKNDTGGPCMSVPQTNR